MAWISLTQRNKQKRILHFSINLLRSPMGNENSYFEAIPWIVLLNNWIWPNVLKRYTSIKFIRYSKSFIGSMGNLMLLSNTIWYWKLYYSYFCNTNKLLDYTVYLQGNKSTGNEIGISFSLLFLLFLYWKCICKIIQSVFISYKTLSLFSFAIKFFKDKKLRKTCILIRIPFVPHY